LKYFPQLITLSLPMTYSRPYTVRFLSKEQVAKDAYSFYFERPKDFEFLSGQYNQWTLPITATDGRGSSRYFTISSSPLEKDKIAFTTKIIRSDFKKALLNLKSNDEIKVFGPMENFSFDEVNPLPRVFIAGGIGITPFHSILSYAAAKNLTMPLTLIASFSHPDEMVFHKELSNLATQHANIKIIYTITDTENSQVVWTGETGRVSKDLIKKYIPDSTQALFYVAGSPAMKEATKIMLKEMKITDEHILTEQFTGY